MAEDSLASIQTLEIVRQSQSKLSSFNTFNTVWSPLHVTATLHKIANMAKCKESVPTPSPIKTLDPIQILHCVNIWMVAILNFGLFTIPCLCITFLPYVLPEPVPGPLALVKTWWPHWNVTQATPGDRDSVLPLHRQSIAGSLVIHLQISSVQLELVNFGPSGAWHKAGLFLIITIMFHEDCDSLWTILSRVSDSCIYLILRKRKKNLLNLCSYCSCYISFHDVTSDKSFNLNLLISDKLYLQNVSHKIR